MRTPRWIAEMLAERQADLERELAALTPPPRKAIVHTADGSCGAKTRAGTPCKITAIYFNGRCRMHGGLSTGPKTADGKRRVAQNLPNGTAKPMRAYDLLRWQSDKPMQTGREN